MYPNVGTYEQDTDIMFLTYSVIVIIRNLPLKCFLL